MDDKTRPDLKLPISMSLSGYERQQLAYLKKHHGLSQSRIVGMLIQYEYRRVADQQRPHLPLLAKPARA